MQALVLDDLRNPVPIGVPGQLCVSGACLAHGYIGSPQLTARRFVPNPTFEAYTDEPHYAKMFCSGDLAVWQPDGSLRYLGPMGDAVRLSGALPDSKSPEGTCFALGAELLRQSFMPTRRHATPEIKCCAPLDTAHTPLLQRTSTAVRGRCPNAARHARVLTGNVIPAVLAWRRQPCTALKSAWARWRPR